MLNPCRIPPAEGMSHESDQENKFDSAPFAGPLNNHGEIERNKEKAQLQTKV